MWLLRLHWLHFGDVMTRKNQFVIRKNQTSRQILQSQHFCKCETLEELVNLNLDYITLMVKEYIVMLREGLQQKQSTIQGKATAIEYFYKVNDIVIIFDESDKVHNYDDEEYELL